MLTVTYSSLAAEWMDLKAQEEDLKLRRLAVEDQLSEFFVLPEEGERSMRLDGYKTTMKAGLNISVGDRPAYEAALAAGLLPSSIVKQALDDGGFKKLRRKAMAQDPAALPIYASILPMFNVRPAKVGVEVVRYE